jgi:hypothetical protein
MLCLGLIKFMFIFLIIVSIIFYIKYDTLIFYISIIFYIKRTGVLRFGYLGKWSLVFVSF